MGLKTGILAAGALLSMLACTTKPVTGSAVLVGDIKGGCNDLIVITYPPGILADYLYPEVQNGHFELALEDAGPFMDMAVAVDDDVFGARVNAGDTLRMTLTARGEGHYDVAYEGSTEAESRVWTDWYDTYGYWGQYNIKPDADPSITPGQSMRKLEEKDAAFRAKYAGRLSEYHTHRADLARDFIKVLLLEAETGYDDSKLFADKRYVDIIRAVDPEDSYTAGSGLLPRWTCYNMRGLADSDAARRMAFLKSYKGKIKNPDSRAVIAQYCAFDLLSDPGQFDDAGVAELVEAIRSFDEGSSDLADRCEAVYEAFNAAKPGAPMPDVEMTAPDGTKTLLSSLKGKVVYIDIWATWCGPCVKETPFMAALAERMKGRDDIVCISLSTDETAEPWLAKLDSDKPAWPQYRLEPEADESFSKALGIRTIPRFIIVGKDGNIYDADAIRPSDPEIDSVLHAAFLP